MSIEQKIARTFAKLARQDDVLIQRVLDHVSARGAGTEAIAGIEALLGRRNSLPDLNGANLVARLALARLLLGEGSRFGCQEPDDQTVLIKIEDASWRLYRQAGWTCAHATRPS